MCSEQRRPDATRVQAAARIFPTGGPARRGPSRRSASACAASIAGQRAIDRRRRAARRAGQPPGPLVVLALAILSSAGVLFWPIPAPQGARMWTFARLHHGMYTAAINDWNARESPRIELALLSIQAVEQRMLSAFLAQTSAAELIEAERRIAARTFAGPLESVGFVDLTDWLREDGLDQSINAASFTPWSTRGRIFGLPHDVHPVMLGYRADLLEAAGIDVSQIETWDDFVRLLRPMMAQRDARGGPRHFLLNLWETHVEAIELLVLQAGGALFDEAGAPTLDRPLHAHAIAQIVAWCSGPERIAADAPYFAASGNKLLLDGYVLASFVPDWMCNIWRHEIPQLAGKVKLMPLPAWRPGGLRTSVWGGTMLGISRTAKDPRGLWRFAKHLYLSPALARALYLQGDIVTPVRTLWDDPVFDRPDAFFCNQPKGRMYLELAPTVPPRSSSPFGAIATARLQDAVVQLAAYARSSRKYTVAELEPEAQRLLGLAQADVSRHVARNAFFEPPARGAEAR